MELVTTYKIVPGMQKTLINKVAMVYVNHQSRKIRSDSFLDLTFSQLSDIFEFAF